ncbi:N-acetylneuraminate epimerase (plasmid) [Escherichia coli]|nr:N-acetylneuraminate epimerase [Escherichia coli]
MSGAYASVIDGNIFLAGGAYFPGAAEKYSNGEYWSHKGLDKAYSKEIYQLIKNDWKKVGSLPEGTCLWCKPALAGGDAHSGGEKKDGKAVSDVIYLKKNDKQIKIVK